MGYRSYMRKRKERERRKVRRYREKVRKKLEKILESVTDKYQSIERVIVFGSFTRDHFDENSDLDLYMSDPSAEEFYEIKRKLEEGLDIEVDLYTGTDDKKFIKKVEERGEILFER